MILCYVRYLKRLGDDESVLLVETPRSRQYLLECVAPLTEQLGFSVVERSRTDRGHRITAVFSLLDEAGGFPLGSRHGARVAEALSARLNPAPPGDRHPRTERSARLTRAA